MGLDRIYAEYGLSDVQIDRTFRFEASWESGSATLKSRTHLPLLSDIVESSRVDFEWCRKDGDSESFRRRAQMIALDTVIPASTSSADSKGKYTSVKEIVAWWEDESGLWLLLRGSTETESVKDRWDKLFAEDEIKWSSVCFLLASIVEMLLVSVPGLVPLISGSTPPRSVAPYM